MKKTLITMAAFAAVAAIATTNATASTSTSKPLAAQGDLIGTKTGVKKSDQHPAASSSTPAQKAGITKMKAEKPVAANDKFAGPAAAAKTAIPTPWVKSNKPAGADKKPYSREHAQAAGENPTVKARLAQRAAAAHKPTKVTERATA